jgi:hypothetical protein
VLAGIGKSWIGKAGLAKLDWQSWIGRAMKYFK